MFNFLLVHLVLLLLEAELRMENSGLSLEDILGYLGTKFSHGNTARLSVHTHLPSSPCARCVCEEFNSHATLSFIQRMCHFLVTSTIPRSEYCFCPPMMDNQEPRDGGEAPLDPGSQHRASLHSSHHAPLGGYLISECE